MVGGQSTMPATTPSPPRPSRLKEKEKGKPALPSRDRPCHVPEDQRTLRQLRCLRAGLSQPGDRSEEHTSELQSLMRISYAVFCLKKQKKQYTQIVSLKNLSKSRHTN